MQTWNSEILLVENIMIKSRTAKISDLQCMVNSRYNSRYNLFPCIEHFGFIEFRGVDGILRLKLLYTGFSKALMHFNSKTFLFHFPNFLDFKTKDRKSVV